MSTKLVVTNNAAMLKKYEKEGLAAITAELAKMVTADKTRGITTTIVDLNLTDAAKDKDYKDSIDTLYQKNLPDYMVLIGATDVIPMQTLNMPEGISGDPDTDVPSDLPYASETGYSTSIDSFLNPTRVIGRIPDIVGSKDFTYLVSLLDTASSWEGKVQKFYENYFGVSAAVWSNSSSLSVKNLYGDDAQLFLSPPNGPDWQKSQVNALSHFINCHGAKNDPKYYGESNGAYPTAMDSDIMVDEVVFGTVAAAECCYGALLFDPTLTSTKKSLSMVNAYLKARGYGFWGSTTVAYGPPVGNGQADLICQYFCIEVLKSASLGRSALTAWQTYIEKETPLSPIDKKTIAQFYLLGDPSIHPVQPTQKSISDENDPESYNQGRDFRRHQLRTKGSLLPAHIVSTVPTRQPLKDHLIDEIAKIAEKENVPIKNLQSYAYSIPGNSEYSAKTLRKITGHMMHIISSTEETPPELHDKIVHLIIFEEGEKIIKYDRVESR